MPVQWNGQQILEKVRQGLVAGIFKTTEEIRNVAIESILAGGQTGKIYRRRGVEHQASAPGEAPASDTGYLAGSISTYYEDGGLTGIVTAGAEYAAYLEFGTVKMEPRPFMRPALDGERENLTQNLIDEVRRALA